MLPVGRYVRARDGVCVHYTADLGAVRSLTAQGLRIAGTVRAIADHARHAGSTPLCRVIADAERLRHCTLRQVGVQLDRRVRFPGKAVLRRAHDDLPTPCAASSRRTVDRDARKAAVAEQLRLLADDAPAVPLFYADEAFAYDPARRAWPPSACSASRSSPAPSSSSAAADPPDRNKWAPKSVLL